MSDGFPDYYLAKKPTMGELNNVRLHVEPDVAWPADRNINPEFVCVLQGIIGDEYPADAVGDRVENPTKFHIALAEMCGIIYMK